MAYLQDYLYKSNLPPSTSSNDRQIFFVHTYKPSNQIQKEASLHATS